MHPLPSSESSPATRRLVLIRSPSPLSSGRPQPTPPAHFFPGQLEEQLQADRASNVPPSLLSNVPFNLHVAPLGPFTPRLNLSHFLSVVIGNTTHGSTLKMRNIQNVWVWMRF